MKLEFIFSSLFWGVILVLLGLSFILRIPLFRIIFGLILIFWGIHVITGKSCCKMGAKGKAIFRESILTASSGDDETDVVFGKSRIDFSGITITDKTVKKTLNTVFGSCAVKINQEGPVRIRVKTVFASAVLPDGNNVNFGNYLYQTGSFKEGSPCLEIEASVVFGELIINQ